MFCEKNDQARSSTIHLKTFNNGTAMYWLRMTRIVHIFLLLCISGMISGCSRDGNSVVGETDEYSYEDVAAQISAEEEAASAEDSE